MAPSPIPTQRFVRYHWSDERSASAIMTLTASTPGVSSQVDNHVILQKIAQSNPQQAAHVQAQLHALMARESEVLAWLESDPAHTRLFLTDPAQALRQALGDLPADFFDQWRQP